MENTSSTSQPMARSRRENIHSCNWKWVQGEWCSQGTANLRKGRGEKVHRRKKCLRLWGSLLVIGKGTLGLWRRAGKLGPKQGHFFPLSCFVELGQAHSFNRRFCPNLFLGFKPRHISSEAAPTEPRGLLSDQIFLKTSEWSELA